MLVFLAFCVLQKYTLYLSQKSHTKLYNYLAMKHIGWYKICNRYLSLFLYCNYNRSAWYIVLNDFITNALNWNIYDTDDPLRRYQFLRSCVFVTLRSDKIRMKSRSSQVNVETSRSRSGHWSQSFVYLDSCDLLGTTTGNVNVVIFQQ